MSMDNLEKVIEHIREEARAECEEISRRADEECRRIRAEYANLEQEEYWKNINTGTKDVEHRHEQLKNLAAMESKKKLISTRQEMVDRAFSLAEKKLLELPERDYAKLQKRLGMAAKSSHKDIIEKYRSELSPLIVTTLFD